AMEMVSWEIMDALEDLHDIDRDKLHLLHEMFTLADMVKFAKASPLPDENERCLRAAADFVRATIPSANEAQDTKGIPHTNSEPSDTDNKA
ncbi:MAG TPA: hypothetical protein P5550_12645, partial [Bacteroidales bacterium]|nr:hypothetical protein [Bacteroidales bacterium]